MPIINQTYIVVKSRAHTNWGDQWNWHYHQFNLLLNRILYAQWLDLSFWFRKYSKNEKNTNIQMLVGTWFSLFLVKTCFFLEPWFIFIRNKERVHSRKKGSICREKEICFLILWTKGGISLFFLENEMNAGNSEFSLWLCRRNWWSYVLLELDNGSICNEFEKIQKWKYVVCFKT